MFPYPSVSLLFNGNLYTTATTFQNYSGVVPYFEYQFFSLDARTGEPTCSTFLELGMLALTPQFDIAAVSASTGIIYLLDSLCAIKKTYNFKCSQSINGLLPNDIVVDASGRIPFFFHC